MALGTEAGEIAEVAWARSAVASNATQANRACALLVGTDRLYLYCEGQGGKGKSWLWGEVERLCDSGWDTMVVPPAYLADNWPLVYACADASMHRLAVAGRRGLAYYNLKRQRWVMFANAAHEQDFACRGGLAWWQAQLLVACETADKTFELRVYGDVLDNNSLLARRPLSHPALRIDTVRDWLVVATEDLYADCR